MKALEKYRLCNTWRGRIKVIYFFHSIKISKSSNWSMRKTAKHFSISVGAVSEAILLATNLARVRHIKNRREALNWIKRHG